MALTQHVVCVSFDLVVGVVHVLGRNLASGVCICFHVRVHVTLIAKGELGRGRTTARVVSVFLVVATGRKHVEFACNSH